MKRTIFALAALAGAAVSAPAPAPAPTPAPAPAPVAYEPAPVAVANVGSPAPYAPVTDGLLQNNPASQGSLSSVLSIPHRWAEKRVAVFQWSGTNSALAYGTMDNIFVGFQANTSRGDITGGYTTPAWSAGLRANFGKRWRSTTDSVNGRYQANQESDATYAADGFEILGSYNMDPYHISGALVWRTCDTSSSWQTSDGKTRGDHSARYDSIGMRLGVRTYVTEKEGFAWRVGTTIFERFLRPSGSEVIDTIGGTRITASQAFDSSYEKTEVYDLGITGDIGYRYAAPGNTQLNVGLNSAFTTTNGNPDALTTKVARHDNVDYTWTLRTRPNVGILIPVFERWTLLGGAGIDVAYTSTDAERGEDKIVVSTLTTASPTGGVGLRFAKDMWSIQAQIANEFLSTGPYLISGQGSTNNAMLAQFALTVNLK